MLARRQRAGALLVRVRRLTGECYQTWAAIVFLRRLTGPILASRTFEWGGLDVHSAQRSKPAKILVQGGVGLRAVPVPKAVKSKEPPNPAPAADAWRRFKL